VQDVKRHEWHKKQSRYAVAVGVLAVATALASCSSSGSGGGSSDVAANDTAPPASNSQAAATGSDAVATAQANVAKYSATVTSYPDIPAISGGVSSLKGKSVWYVPLGGSLPIFQGFGSGIKQAAEAAGMSFHTCDGKLVPTTMVSCLNLAATQGAAGVIGGYID
jgi:ribose transport system substrate-binding protein